MADREYGFKTRAIHAGNIPDQVTGARALPIYQSSAFVFDDTADAAARFALQKYGNIYSRLANPTVASFEERVASLEGGLGAVATASGLSAQYITFASLAGTGDHIVASANLYGGSITQLDVTLRRFGIETTFVQSADAADYAAAITDKTKALFVETI
ncbi:MAG: PLP-dependent transferase, partial [Agromyces sp.]